MTWPTDFVCIPADDWSSQPLEELAMKYDTVEEHGWYDNLNPTVSQLAQRHGPEDIVMDYSGGTGILTARLKQSMGGNAPHALIVDSSPKFLRLALEKFKTDPRVAYRLIRYLKPERRLQFLQEVLEPPLWDRGLDAIVSTNAIHLYYQLEQTLSSWHAILRPTGCAYIQSGNIRNPDAPADSWIIDETVEHIHKASIEIVLETDGYQEFRPLLDNPTYMEAHDKLRAKYFLPVRDISHYTDAFKQSRLDPVSITMERIPALVSEWYEFLSVYHEGALGWIGGAMKITGKSSSPEVVERRKALMWESMQRIFEGRPHFDACWNYFICERR